MRPARSAIVAAVLVGALGAIVLVAGGGSDPYVVKLRLDNAGGLRNGSDVVTGGVKIGQVHLALVAHDRVEADLQIERSHAPVGQDATAAIAAANFLGRKRVELTFGDVSRPAPDGFVIPTARVTTSTDLDQVLNVLDADTRARLGILINEAGVAFTGRRQDFNNLLDSLPHAETKARVLLGRLVADNHTLADTLTTSDRFVGTVTAQRKELSRMVAVLGAAAQPTADRRAQLRETLRRAPETLRTLQRFLADLRTTTVPLGPAARDLTAAAPALSDTIAQVEPFRRAAEPALRAATAAAPQLTRLATGATPVLRQASPVVAQVATLSEAAVPVTKTLDHSVDNVLAIVQNWSRAIQFRDGLSHIFRGEALFSPETIRSLVERLGVSLNPGALPAGRAKTRGAAPAASSPVPAASAPATAPAPSPGAGAAPGLGGIVDAATGAVGGLAGGGNPGSKNSQDLLDYLLGK
jgi:phospholipid/cholesterol/gamma-HCH transport system substrate-binding protein